jgi:hypothetical protein
MRANKNVMAEKKAYKIFLYLYLLTGNNIASGQYQALQKAYFFIVLLL